MSTRRFQSDQMSVHDPLVPPVVAEKRGLTKTLVFCALVGTIQACQNGWNIGVINFPQEVISEFLGIDPKGAYWSVGIVAMYSLGGFIGAHYSGTWANRFGRKVLIFLLNWTFVVSTIMILISFYSKNKDISLWMLIISRLLTGVGAGAGSVVTPMYLGEIGDTHQKAALGALYQFAVVLFLLLAQLVGLKMSTPKLWGLMFSITGVLALIGLFLTPMLVESPEWLAGKGKRNKTIRALTALRGYTTSEAANELSSKLTDGGTAPREATPNQTIWEIIKNPLLQRPLLAATFIQMSQQLSGINAVFYYSASFFRSANINDSLGTVLSGVVNLVSSAIAIPVIKRFGRKTLIIFGAGGMLLSAIVLTSSLVAKDAHPEKDAAFGIMSIVFVLLFVFFFNFGLGAIPWNIACEMFAEDTRGKATALAGAANWISNMIVGITFPFVQKALGNYSFVPFAVWLALTVLVTIVFVPETKGKSPHEIQRWFLRHSRETYLTM